MPTPAAIQLRKSLAPGSAPRGVSAMRRLDTFTNCQWTIRLQDATGERHSGAGFSNIRRRSSANAPDETFTRQIFFSPPRRDGTAR